MNHTPMQLKQCAVPGFSLLEIGPNDQHGYPASSVQLPTATVIQIIRACNSHSALVAACKSAHALIQDILGEGIARTRYGDLRLPFLVQLEREEEKLHEALAAAREEIP